MYFYSLRPSSCCWLPRPWHRVIRRASLFFLFPFYSFILAVPLSFAASSNPPLSSLFSEEHQSQGSCHPSSSLLAAFLALLPSLIAVEAAAEASIIIKLIRIKRIIIAYHEDAAEASAAFDVGSIGHDEGWPIGNTFSIRKQPLIYQSWLKLNETCPSHG